MQEAQTTLLKIMRTYRTEYGENVYPLHKNKYYVYTLCRPNGIPFYIGKGINGRINNHFKPSELKTNTPKNATIKKYRDKIKREIIAYFDSEESAYEYEEWLISQYKLSSEGGVLKNYAKTRFQYSELFTKNVSSEGYKHREVKYSEDIITLIYKLYYTYLLHPYEINDVLNINLNISMRHDYIAYLLKGSKRKDLYEKYIVGGLVVNNKGRYETSIATTARKRDPSLCYHLFQYKTVRMLNNKDISAYLDYPYDYVEKLSKGVKSPNIVGVYNLLDITRFLLFKENNPEKEYSYYGVTKKVFAQYSAFSLTMCKKYVPTYVRMLEEFGDIHNYSEFAKHLPEIHTYTSFILDGLATAGEGTSTSVNGKDNSISNNENV